MYSGDPGDGVVRVDGAEDADGGDGEGPDADEAAPASGGALLALADQGESGEEEGASADGVAPAGAELTGLADGGVPGPGAGVAAGQNRRDGEDQARGGLEGRGNRPQPRGEAFPAGRLRREGAGRTVTYTSIGPGSGGGGGA